MKHFLDEFTPRRIDKAFDKLLDVAGLKLSDIAILIDKKNFRFSELNFQQVAKISQYFNLSFERIVDGTFCHDALRKQLSGNKLYIPKKYQQAPNSNMFTFRHIHQLAASKGFGDYLLQHFQIKQDALLNDMPISVELLSDMLNKFSFLPYELIKCGEKNPQHLKNSTFGKKMKSSKNPIELIQNWISVEKYLEENWYYKIIQLDNQKCIFNGYPTESMMEYHKRNDYSSLNVSFVRIGAAKMFSSFIGISSQVTLTKSIHRGDSFDQFHIAFEQDRNQSCL